uniref:C-type lectin domain-containing protein n=1 Tax=Podarcis muralis TaxID=64176 RepID=A0A670JF33_PODMU
MLPMSGNPSSHAILNMIFLFLGRSKPIKCSHGWAAYEGHCYRLYRHLKTWPQALSSCRKEGGDLISIHNIEEHSFIISQLGYRKYIQKIWHRLLQPSSAWFHPDVLNYKPYTFQHNQWAGMIGVLFQNIGGYQVSEDANASVILHYVTDTPK